MKTYVCDCCKKIIENPYEVKMKEFCFTVSNCDIYQIPEQTKKKVKIHLCDDCYQGLGRIAIKGAIKNERKIG